LNTRDYQLHVDIRQLGANTSINYIQKQTEEYYAILFTPEEEDIYVARITITVNLSSSNISKTRFIVINVYNIDDKSLGNKILGEINETNGLLGDINNSLNTLTNHVENKLNSIEGLVESNTENLNYTLYTIYEEIYTLSKNKTNNLLNNLSYINIKIKQLEQQIDNLILKSNNILNKTSNIWKEVDSLNNRVDSMNSSLVDRINNKYNSLFSELKFVTITIGFITGFLLLLVIIFIVLVVKR
jgi:hypothetical protein